MPLAARVLLISPAHLPTLRKNIAKSCICHTSAKSASKSFICHTSKNALPQVLCLPHLRVPPGVPYRFLLKLERVLVAIRHCVQPASVYLGSLALRWRVRGFVGFSRVTSHKSRVTLFQILQRRRMLLFSSRVSRTKISSVILGAS